MIGTKSKYYNSPKTLPTWNYYEISRTGDLRYLLNIDDYSELPEKFDKELLTNVYLNRILYEMPPDSFHLEMIREEYQLSLYENKVEIGEDVAALVFFKRQQNKIKRLKEASKNNNSFNLEERVLDLEEIFEWKLKIDTMTLPISKFKGLENKAIKKIKRIEQQQKKRRNGRRN